MMTTASMRPLWRLCASASAAAIMLAGAGAASAQQASRETPAPAAPPLVGAPGDQATAPDIIVTGSRIVSSGYTQPTPVTQVSAEQLSLTSPGSLSQSLAPLPELRLSTNPQGGQNASGNMGGISQLNLRGLGVNRTLVLLDGRRLAPANTGSAPDINMLPQELIKRVEIVTGGASAAYGSDAVAGVVNFILDEDLRGFHADAQAGVTQRGDGGNQKVGAALGLHLLDDKLHIIGSAEYYNRGAVYASEDRAWTTGHYLPLTNPAVTAANPASPTNPTFIIAPNVTVASGTPGGLITSGPLVDTQFIDGQPTPFIGGALRTAGFQQGGSGVSANNIAALALSLRRNLEFVHLAYDLTDTIHAFASASHGSEVANSLSQVAAETFTIFNGNPYIPASLPVGALASFPLSKFNLDTGGSRVFDKGTNREFSAGLKGTFELGGHGFAWDASYENGRSSYTRKLLNNINQINIFNAADSVRVTAANQGSSGLPIGSIVCRTSLTVPGNGCVPINPFIPLTANSQAAQNYLFFEASFHQTIRQQSAQGNISGAVFDDWAGPIAMATGVEYRKISTTVTSDALSQTLPATYIAATAPGIRGLPAAANSVNLGVGQFSNFQPLAGGFDVKEVFVEVDVPLARDLPFLHAANLHAAYRYTDYSTSGGVSTWKVGLTLDITDQIRLRGTRSRDIRAPNIAELLLPKKQQGTTVTDPALGNVAFSTSRFDQGNPDLKPERGDTLTGGLVFRPHGRYGFGASIDGYDIKIKDAIVLLIAQDVVSGCYSGVTEYCALITRAGGSPTGLITGISTSYLNGQQIHQRGIDFEASYGLPLDRIFKGSGGSMLFRVLANYVDKFSLTQRAGLPAIDKAGEVGVPTSGSTGVYGVPHWSGTVSATYADKGFTAYLQGRYVGGGKYDNTYNTDRFNVAGQAITYINDNHISARFYTDLTLRRSIGAGARLQISATVENLFDVDPPIDPSRASTLPTQTNGFLYDTLGRRYSIGASVKF